MKFLTIKRVSALVLVLAIGIIAGIYFIAGVKPFNVEFDNIDFDDTGFVDFNSSGGVQNTNFKFYRTNEDGTEEEVVFDRNKKIDENDKYIMVIDEDTTIISVIDKSNSSVVYQTGVDKGTDDRPHANNDATASNLIVKYAQKSNGKLMDTGLDTYQYSVAFENKLTGQLEKHYKIKYLEDSQGNFDGVQILYTVGRFSANEDYFPSYLESMTYDTEDSKALLNNQYSLEYLFGGNTIITTADKTEYADGSQYRVRSYTGNGRTYSKAVADYLEENNLAVVTEGSDYWDFSQISPELYDSYGVHINTPESPITMNPFMPNLTYVSLKQYYGNATIPYKSGAEVVTEDDARPVYKLPPSNQVVLSNLYRYLYTSVEDTYVSNQVRYPIYDEEMNPITVGGYHARDEEGNYLYDEEGNPIQELFSLDRVAEINAHFGVETATSLARFQVGLQVKLTDDGILASVMADSLRDSDHKDLDSQYNHDYIMRTIDMLPELTTLRDKTAEGMMIIPDGSGAIINFNNNKAIQNYSPYSSNVYGLDYGFTRDRRPEQTQTLMFGMYGFLDITNKRGLMTVAEKGAAQSTLFADTPRGSSNANYIYYAANIRQNESVIAGTGWNSSAFMKWATNLSPMDVEYRYVFLEESELNYVSLANKYRDYLINKYNLEEKDNTTTNLVDLNFLGAFERYALFLGVKYMKDDTLTTFTQAIEIIEELKGNNVNNLNVGYESWTNKEFEYETTSKLKVSKVLGGTKGFMDLNTYLESNGINFYPEMYVTSSKGYDYSFGNMKYTAKSVGNFYAEQYPYNLATLAIDKSLQPTYYLNPSFYQPIAERLFDSYSRFGVNGAYLKDLGRFRLGSYNRNNEVYASHGELYQIAVMDYIQSEYSNLKLSAPFDYAFPFVQTAVDIPLVASTYGIFDASIPFYHLVASGLFDYTTQTVNGTSDKNTDWYFAKALETGSNLQFLVSYTDPEVLLDTDYTMYYKSFYDNWKDTIINMNNNINEANIHGGRLINHEIISKDVSKVTYSHGLTIVVNVSSLPYNYEGVDIPSYGYKVL